MRRPWPNCVLKKKRDENLSFNFVTLKLIFYEFFQLWDLFIIIGTGRIKLVRAKKKTWKSHYCKIS